MKKIIQAELILEFFKKNPKRSIKHPEIVDWVTEQYKRKTGEVFRDPDRAIRKLHQEGVLQKVAKGVYRYEPGLVTHRELHEFSSAQKEQIFKRDNYRCVICGRGKKEGLEIHADHIKPRDKGGEATIENGQTLCAEHNFRKKNYNQTESGKRMFILLLDEARKVQDTKTIAFCEAVLKQFDTFGVNGHIEWQ